MSNLSSGDKNVVFNIRYDLKTAVDRFTDEQIATMWRHFSQSDDFNSENRNDKFLEWLETIEINQGEKG